MMISKVISLITKHQLFKMKIEHNIKHMIIKIKLISIMMLLITINRHNQIK